MNIKLIVFLLVLIVVGFVGVWSFEQWDSKPFQSPAITPFQHQMLLQGYSRDHLTHRWYNASEAYTNNGCVVYGSPLNATFNCRTPLTDGIPDEK